MSMINRRKLIDKLNSYHYTAIGMRCGKKMTAEIIKGYHDHVIEVIESQPPADQWIPCSERLPDEDGWYWVTEDKPYSGVTPLSYFNTETERFSRPLSYSEVVAWMPSNMPEPYKGVE